jgi:hypothetical protein
MSHSNKQSLSYSWLHVLRMLDKAAWIFAQRKVDASTLVEKNEIVDKHGAEYTEYVFHAMSYVPFHIYYIRLWLRHKGVNVPRIERVLVTSSEAVIFGEWIGESFASFVEDIDRVSLQVLNALILTQPPLAPYIKHSIQLSWMLHEMVITQQASDFIVVQAHDINLGRPVAELTLHCSNGRYWVETVKLFESLSIEIVSRTHHYSENLWLTEHKEID